MVNKKIVDIYIPDKKEQKKIEEQVSKKAVTLNFKEKKEEKPKVHSSILNKKKLLWGGAMILFLLTTLFLFSLGKAEVVYWPETEDLKVDTILTIDVSANDVDVSGKVIPGLIFKKEKTVTENFVATGKATKEGKARGMITVYNEYSTTKDQILIATTRFISAEGKLFRTPVRVVIPKGHLEGGKLIPGEKQIEVIADETGPEFNIEPSIFSIPGFAGSNRYTKFHARSFSPMVGGFLSGSSLIVEDDIENAKDIVINKAEKEVEQLLLQGLQAEEMVKYVSIDKAISTEIKEESPLALAGQEADNFNYQAKAISQALIFEKSDLDNFVDQFLLTKVSEGSKIYKDSLEVNYVQESINLNTGKIILSLSISAKAYVEINTDNLKRIVSGKSLVGSKIIVENQIGVTKVEVDFWPFWVKKAPQSTEKITVEMKID